jgi:hypothetical protein
MRWSPGGRATTSKIDEEEAAEDFDPAEFRLDQAA